MAAAIAGAGPRTFVERLYASYRHNSEFSPLDEPERIFAPPLLSAIRADQRLARGEVGFLDGDPLCDCQDTHGMRVRIEAFSANRMRANARLVVRFAGTHDRRDISLKLVRTVTGWRIADVGTRSEPSLLRGLLASNRKPAKR